LFVRERNNNQLTPAGERFLGHARSMLKSWEQACYEVAVDADPRPNLTLLAVPGLWDGFRPDWLSDLDLRQPELSLRIEILTSIQVTARLQQNSADLGLLLEPTVGPELHLRELGQLELIMVSTIPGQTARDAVAGRYVLVDWSTSFHAQHANAFPAALPPRIWVSTGRIAHDLILATGGAAYLPRGMVEADLQQARLHPVSEAPVIALPTYAAYPVWSERELLISQALETVKAGL
jgi:DNA-binding transcriptional LysR family regulator